MTTTTSSRATTAGARVATGAFSARSLLLSLPQAIGKLDPRGLVHNPVMFVVEIGAALTTVLAVADPTFFAWLIAVWLWLTVVFANLAEAVAEGRGRAQAASLRATRKDTTARRLGPDGGEERVAASGLRTGDLVVCESGDLVPGDGDVIEGVASVDESAITGESAPVIRESGGDRSAVTGGTRVLSDRIVVHITAEPGHTFIDRMIALVEGAARRKTPNEVALSVLLSTLTIIFLLAVATLPPFADYSGAPQSVVVLVALLVCLIPTTIGALLSAIGIAGMDRLVQRNVLAMSGRAVEAAGDVSTLLLDKTGTITFGNRQASELVPRPVSTSSSWPRRRSWPALPTRRLRDGRSSSCARSRYGLREPAEGDLAHAEFVPVLRADPDERRRHRRPAGAQGRGRGGCALGARARRAARPAGRRDSSRRSRPRAAPRSSWPSRETGRRGCSAWSTSRTSSRTASPNDSPSCARWASAPS